MKKIILLFAALFVFQGMYAQNGKRVFDNMILGNPDAFFPLADGWYVIEASYSGKLVLGTQTFNSAKLQRYLACFDQNDQLVWKKDIDAFTMAKTADGKKLRWIEQVRVKDKEKKNEQFDFMVKSCGPDDMVTQHKIGPFYTGLYNGNIKAAFTGKENITLYGLFHQKTGYVSYKETKFISKLEGAVFYFTVDLTGKVVAKDKVEAGVDGFTYPTADKLLCTGENSFYLTMYFGAKCQVPQVQKNFTTEQTYGYRPGEMPLYLVGMLLLYVENGKIKGAEKVLEGNYLQSDESYLGMDKNANVYIASFAQGNSVYHKENDDGYADYNPPMYFNKRMADCGLHQQYASLIDNSFLVQVKPGLQPSWTKVFKSNAYNRPTQLLVTADSVYLMLDQRNDIQVDGKTYPVKQLTDKEIVDNILLVMDASGKICRNSYFYGDGRESVYVKNTGSTLVTFGSHAQAFTIYGNQWVASTGRQAFVVYPGRTGKGQTSTNYTNSNTGLTVQKGDRVFAYYAADKKYYSATVMDVQNGTVTVKYDDAYVEDKKNTELKLLQALKVGEVVQAKRTDGKFYPATVLSMALGKVSVVYNADGTKETVSADRIMQVSW